MDVKKILIVIYQNKLGGAEKQAILYANAINQVPGYAAEIIFCLEEVDEVFRQYCADMQVKCTYIPLFNIGARNFLPKLYYILKLRMLKPFGLIAFTTMPNLFTGLIWKYTGAKFFLWNQLDVLELPSYIDRSYFHKAYGNATGAIVNAKHSVRFLEKTFPVVKPSYFIGNAIDIETGRISGKSLNEVYGIEEGSMIVTMVANLQVNKDHLTVLKALLQIPERYKVHVMFVGYLGANTEGVINFVNRNRLRDKVTLCGQVENVSSVLQYTHLLIHSSKSEGMSVAVLEAVLSDIPVVATRIPGNIEVMGEQYKYYFEVADETSLANAIIAALDNYGELKQYAYDLHRELAPLYSREHMKETLAGILHKMA